MNLRATMKTINFASRLPHLRIMKAVVGALLISITAAGCATSYFEQTMPYTESKFPLNAPNFEMDAVHTVGRAGCAYILFTIPLCDDQAIVTVAWEQMRQEAKMDGKSAQFINVFEDRTLRWNFLYFFYYDSYTVSADVVAYR